MSTRNTWKAGVIGCGSIAQVMHIPGYLKTKGVELAAACDPAAERRAEVQKLAPDVCMYPDYRAMLDAGHFDVVSVCSPNCFHAEHACAALEAGANVLLEKPAALSMAEIARIRSAVETSGRRLIMGFSHRFQRGNQKMRELVREGAIGEPFMIRLRLAHSGPYPGWAKSTWFYDPKLAGGGAMLDMGIHMIDQALWLMGPVRAVQAQATTLRKDIAVDDNAVLLLEFERPRALGYIEVGWTTHSGFRGIEVLGDEGSILLDYAGPLTMTTGKMTPDESVKANMETRVIDPKPATGGWASEVQEVVKAFREGSDLDAGIAAGGAALAVALAGYESSRTGRRIDVAQVS